MMTDMSTSAISVSGLRKAYGDKVVLGGIDLDVRPGTVFSLLGPNGAGKTTTVNVLTTLLKADGGTARVAGDDVAAGAEARVDLFRRHAQEAGPGDDAGRRPADHLPRRADDRA